MRPISLGKLIGSLLAECTVDPTQRTPVTGMRALDDALGGFLAVGQHILQAAPGDGKSALALQFASDCGSPSLFITAEMAPTEIFRRLIARTTTTPLGQLKGAIPREILARLATQTATKLSRIAILDATREYATPDDIRRAVSEVKNEAGGNGLFLVLDSLQVWARSAGLPLSEYDLINLAVRNARDLAFSLNSAALLISHRNRAGQQHGGLFASKGSGDLEYAAETVLELTKEPNARANAAGEIPVALAVLKNRHGDAGAKIQLKFSGKYQSFRQAGGP